MSDIPHPDWVTPEQLAEQMGRPVRWVKEAMTSGELPSVKVRGRRYWTPGCMAELERKHLAETEQAVGWGRKTRRGAA